jgi:quercetin dioxygenase-like cupin family protein
MNIFMQSENIYTSKEKKVNEAYFTGNVTIREVLSEANSAEQEMYHVTFHNGARTTLHSHESDQILIATRGRGVIGLINGNSINEFIIEDDDILFLEKEGDTVCIPNNKLHFHGAIRKGEDFSHIAIRKLHKTDPTTGSIKRAENKWEYDLIPEETGVRDPEAINRIADEISRRIQTAISQRLQNSIK